MYHLRILASIVLTVVLTLFAPGSYSHAASAPVMKSKTLFNLEGHYRQPSDVVAGTNDRIYVLDGVNNRVQVHAGSGQHLFSFGTAGSGNGEFNFPLGIGIDDTNRIYVADSGNHRVQIFSPEGTFLAKLSTETDPGQLKPSDPTDVAAYLPLKRCTVVDNDNHRIIIYDLETMKPLASEGVMGLGKKEFRFPFLLAVDNQGNLYIVEVINTRVKVLDPDGNYSMNIGEWGVEKGQLYRPKGVAIDPDQRVYVSDSYLGVIQVFDRQGRFVSILGDEKGEVKRFKAPTGIFIDKQKRLYVVEMLADRVQVIQLPD